jgi:hypothetical protein
LLVGRSMRRFWSTKGWHGRNAWASGSTFPWLELLALTALCELDSVKPEHLDALREARHRLQECASIALTPGAQHLLPRVGPELDPLAAHEPRPVLPRRT